MVTVELIDCLIGPAKADGRPWDGMGTVPHGLPGAVGKALSLANPHAAIVELLADPTMRGIEAPEPSGTARLVVRGTASEAIKLSFPGQRDTLTPLWKGPPTWHQVPLDGSTRLRVTLVDKDMANDDPMGVFELNASDFRAALETGHVHHIQVAEQTQNQILFVGLSVWAE